MYRHEESNGFGRALDFGSVDGKLYAVNKTDGTLLWKFESEGEKSYGLWDYYLSSPKGDKETIYWGSGDGMCMRSKAEVVS